MTGHMLDTATDLPVQEALPVRNCHPISNQVRTNPGALSWTLFFITELDLPSYREMQVHQNRPHCGRPEVTPVIPTSIMDGPPRIFMENKIYL